MRKIAVVLSAFAVLLIAAGCQSQANKPAAPLSTPELKQLIGSGKATVVFFLNPQGGPCQAQNGILQQLYKDRGGNFNVAYVSAMKRENEQAFYDYGVRSLPTIVLVDTKGRISRVFPPGIQDYATLASSLDSLK